MGTPGAPEGAIICAGPGRGRLAKKAHQAAAARADRQAVSPTPGPRDLARQSLELPPQALQEFRELASREGNSVKAAGAAAIFLLLGLPSHISEPLLLWADLMIRRSPEQMRKGDAWSIVEAAIKRGPEASPISSRALLELLLDTEREPGEDDAGSGQSSAADQHAG